MSWGDPVAQQRKSKAEVGRKSLVDISQDMKSELQTVEC